MCATSSPCVSFKPWDSLRPPAKKPPIGSGLFKTTCKGAKVRVSEVTSSSVRLATEDMYGEFNGQYFHAPDLRDLAGLANELADQLDGKC